MPSTQRNRISAVAALLGLFGGCGHDPLAGQPDAGDSMDARGEDGGGGDDLAPAEGGPFTCAAAAAFPSHLGCEFWPTTTLNSLLNPYFDFGVVVINPAQVERFQAGDPAEVTIWRGRDIVAQQTITPGSAFTFSLPWVRELTFSPSCGNTGNCTPTTPASTLVTSGAYRLLSTSPVAVQQLSPLQFKKKYAPNCADNPYKGCTSDADCRPGDKCALDPRFGDKRCADHVWCHPFNGDASLLLPWRALGREYIVIARQTDAENGKGFTPRPQPGFAAVVATVDGTEVTVTSSAYTETGTGVSALAPGASQNFQLNQGDVLQLVSKRDTMPCANMSSDDQGDYCDLGRDFDLTGTTISATHPVAVFGGHACSFVPYNRWACDHLEEQIPPVETWGKTVLLAQTPPVTPSEPNVFRVISGADGNTVTFDPVSVHGPVTLPAHTYVDITANGAFAVTGTSRLAVAQYMVGGAQTPDSNVGDPSLGVAVPVEQYRRAYDLFAADAIDITNLIVIAPIGAAVTLDGTPLPEQWQPIGGSGYGYQYEKLVPGVHHVAGDAPIAVYISGLGSYASYLLAGGQNFNPLK